MAPSKGITSADEAKVKAGTITPSPGLIFNPSKDNNNASVPLEQHKTYLEPLTDHQEAVKVQTVIDMIDKKI